MNKLEIKRMFTDRKLPRPRKHGKTKHHIWEVANGEFAGKPIWSVHTKAREGVAVEIKFFNTKEEALTYAKEIQ